MQGDSAKAKKKKKTSPTVPYMLQTLSSRTPKPPDRYQEEDTKEEKAGPKKERGAHSAKQRHKSSSNTVVINKCGVKNEDSSDDEITFSSNSKSQACRITNECHTRDVFQFIYTQTIRDFTKTPFNLQVSPSLSVLSPFVFQHFPVKKL